MDIILMGAALLLLINLLVGLPRLFLGPGAADRMQALLLFGTTTVAVLLLLAYAGNRPILVHVALVFVMLAAIAGIAFVQIPRELGKD